MFAVAGLPPSSECLACPSLAEPLLESPVAVPDFFAKDICMAVGAVISEPRMSAAIISAGIFTNAFSLNSLPPLQMVVVNYSPSPSWVFVML